MSIATYADLQTAIGNWINRTDLAAARLQEWIALAESRMNGHIKSRSMEARTTLTCTPSSAYVTLPTDVIDVRRLIVSSTTPARVLKYLTPDALTNDYPGNDTGEPGVFTVIGGSAQLAPIPDSAYSLELAYVQSIPALSASNTTNWLLTKHPGVYLYGSLLQGIPYLKAWSELAAIQQLYRDAVDNANALDWYSGSTPTVRAV